MRSMNGMSTSDATEYDELSGYSVNRDSSPADGADNDGTPPGATEAAPDGSQTRHEPPPGSPRFSEVYRKWKDAERRLEEFEAKEMEQAISPPQQPQPEVTGDSQESSGEMDWFWEESDRRIEATIQKALKPVMDREEIRASRERFDAFRNTLKAEFGDAYDPARDDAMLATTVKQGVRDPILAFRATFPERVGQQQGPVPPVADVPASSGGPRRDSVAELRAKLNDPNTDIYERERIIAALTSAGDYGGTEAEKALGF
jgi:hypothetical protein